MSKEIVARNDVGFVVLRRRPIESYISTLKAKNSNAYRIVDTTALRPTLEPAPFSAMGRTSSGKWYAFPHWMNCQPPKGTMSI